MRLSPPTKKSLLPSNSDMKWKSLSANGLTFTTPLPNEDVLSRLTSENSPILDIGCGYGRTLQHLETKGYSNLTGIDVSPALVEQAKANCVRAKIILGDFKNLDVLGSDCRYELILLMGIIEYILTDEEQERLFADVSELLTSRGTVFLETFLIDWKLNWKQYLLGFLETGHIGRFRNSKGIECHHQSECTLLSIIRKHFDIVRSTRTKLITWSGNSCNGLSALLRRKTS